MRTISSPKSPIVMVCMPTTTKSIAKSRRGLPPPDSPKDGLFEGDVLHRLAKGEVQEHPHRSAENASAARYDVRASGFATATGNPASSARSFQWANSSGER